ncbi:MAG: hypothetical protein CM15mP68_7120 [Pseudomonadota bacterium]|nr:MAG: hypothetical protein CM15mP68_7120 [Pseudomonadota bacterium]
MVLRMIRVVPNWGKPYYLVPEDPTHGNGDLDQVGALVPSWTLKELEPEESLVRQRFTFGRPAQLAKTTSTTPGHPANARRQQTLRLSASCKNSCTLYL